MLLKKGDRVGMMRTSGGELHFYVNDKDQGVASQGVPEKVYGVVELHGRALAVSIIDPKSNLQHYLICWFQNII